MRRCDVCLWPEADMPTAPPHVCSWREDTQVPQVANGHFVSAFGGKATIQRVVSIMPKVSRLTQSGHHPSLAPPQVTAVTAAF
jgi:hypothetical protein